MSACIHKGVGEKHARSLLPFLTPLHICAYVWLASGLSTSPKVAERDGMRPVLDMSWICNIIVTEQLVIKICIELFK